MKTRAEIEVEQGEMSKDEIKELMEKTSEFMLELDNLKPQKHNWHKRGAKMTCEGANHPYHEAWLRKEVK